MEPEHDSNEDQGELSPWDRTLVRSIETASNARTGAKVLRVVAIAAALAALVGQYLYITAFDTMRDESTVFGSTTFSTKQEWGQYLAGVATPLAFAGLVLAASFMLEIYAARLDLDIIVSDADESAE